MSFFFFLALGGLSKRKPFSLSRLVSQSAYLLLLLLEEPLLLLLLLVVVVGRRGRLELDVCLMRLRKRRGRKNRLRRRKRRSC